VPLVKLALDWENFWNREVSFGSLADYLEMQTLVRPA